MAGYITDSRAPLRLILSSISKPIRYNMKIFAFILATLGVASAGILPATIVNKVAVAPAQVTVVRQPVTITQAEPVYRSVPVPVRTVAYTSPVVAHPAPVVSTHSVLAAPSVIASPAIATHYW